MTERITYLIKQKASGAITAPEAHELKELITGDNREAIALALAQVLSEQRDVLTEDNASWEQRIGQVVAVDRASPVLENTPRVPFLQTAWFRVAAILLLVAGSAIYLYLKHPVPQQQIAVKHSLPQQDVQPGGNKAILTLSDGTSIALDSAANGSLARQGAVNILKLEDGMLAYKGGDSKPDAGINTIRTPKGGQYQIVLPDGSRVWLNAASSITFPTVFTNYRKVTLEGEAYFEIENDPARPFYVSKNNVQVQVLGTHFNVNAYDDENSIRVTLLEGSVKVTRGAEAATMRPGQQASITQSIQVLNNINPAEVVAWKEGKFQFGESSDIAAIMRQVSRWYDVEIVYKGAVAGHIGGTISKNVSLLQLLKILETTDVVGFNVEGKRVEVFLR